MPIVSDVANAHDAAASAAAALARRGAIVVPGNPVAVAEAESRLSTPLPEALREFLGTCANGTLSVGAAQALYSAEELTSLASLTGLSGTVATGTEDIGADKIVVLTEDDGAGGLWCLLPDGRVGYVCLPDPTFTPCFADTTAFFIGLAHAGGSELHLADDRRV